MRPENCTIMHNGREINIEKSEDVLRILGKKYSLLTFASGNSPFARWGMRASERFMVSI